MGESGGRTWIRDIVETVWPDSDLEPLPWVALDGYAIGDTSGWRATRRVRMVRMRPAIYPDPSAPFPRGASSEGSRESPARAQTKRSTEGSIVSPSLRS